MTPLILKYAWLIWNILFPYPQQKNLLLLGVGGGAVASGQTTLDADPFNGTAGTALTAWTNPTYPSNAWSTTNISSQYNSGVLSTPTGGAIAGTGACSNYRTGPTWTNDQFAQATLAVVPTSSGWICVRTVGAAGNYTGGYCIGPDPNISGTGYRLSTLPTLVTMNICGGGASACVSATNATVNDVVNVQVKGSAITVKVNGSTLTDISVSDSTFTTGNPALVWRDATGEWSTWSAGSVN